MRFYEYAYLDSSYNCYVCDFIHCVRNSSMFLIIRPSSCTRPIISFNSKRLYRAYLSYP